MVPIELATMGFSALTGFIFKYLAQKSADEQRRYEMFIQSSKQVSENADKAAVRAPNDKTGNFVRRFLVVIICLSIVIFPFVLQFFDKATIVQIEQPVRSFLGIFQWGGKTQFYALNGYLIANEVKLAFLSVISFYFGLAAAKRN